jgi:hypothetical protein
MSSNILTCETCGNLHTPCITLRKMNDYKTKPKYFCCQKCVIDYITLNNWVQFKLDCGNTEILNDILKQLNIINKQKKI